MDMTKLVTTPFDGAQYFTTPESVIDLLNDAFESGHAPYIANALGVAARSEGMSKIAAKTGVNRQALYTALSENGNPDLPLHPGAVQRHGLGLGADHRHAGLLRLRQLPVGALS